MTAYDLRVSAEQLRAVAGWAEPRQAPVMLRMAGEGLVAVQGDEQSPWFLPDGTGATGDLEETCGECGARVPSTGPLVARAHLGSCSLHAGNLEAVRR